MKNGEMEVLGKIRSRYLETEGKKQGRHELKRIRRKSSFK